MRFSKLFVAALALVGLLAQDPRAARSLYPDVDLSTAELVALLEKHNLAIVPKSELTDALTELNALLKANRIQPRQVPHFKRQNTTSDGILGGLPDLGDLTNLLGGLLKDLDNMGDLLKALESLLTPEFLQGFYDAMVYLAAALQLPAPDLIQGLLKQGGPLLDMLSGLDLKGLLDQL
jgi:hypothetical protein